MKFIKSALWILLGIVGYLMLNIIGSYCFDFVDISFLYDTGEGFFYFSILFFVPLLISIFSLGVFLRYLPCKIEKKNHRLLLVGLILAVGASYNYLMIVKQNSFFWKPFIDNGLFLKDRFQLEVHRLLTFEYRFYLAIGLTALSATLIAISIKKQTQWKSILIFCIWIIAGPLTAFLSVPFFYKFPDVFDFLGIFGVFLR